MLRWWQTVVLFMYLLLISLVLIIAPWTQYWMVSIFASSDDALGLIYKSVYFRSSISLLGTATFLTALKVISGQSGRKS